LFGRGPFWKAYWLACILNVSGQSSHARLGTLQNDLLELERMVGSRSSGTMIPENHSCCTRVTRVGIGPMIPIKDIIVPIFIGTWELASYIGRTVVG
jgi:hypothetical protein